MHNLQGLKLKESVTLVSIEDLATALDLERMCTYDLNETAFFILDSTEGGISLEDIKTELLSSFEVDADAVSSDLNSFVGELLTLGLVGEWVAGVPRQGEGREAAARRAYQSPRLEYQTEIAVAAAVAPVSPGTA